MRRCRDYVSRGLQLGTQAWSVAGSKPRSFCGMHLPVLVASAVSFLFL